MKIRNGFVSNSSSSSFVLAIRQEHFNDVISKAHPHVQALAQAVGVNDEVLGVRVVMFEGYDEHGESWLDGIDLINYEGEQWAGDPECINHEVWQEVEKLFHVHYTNKHDRDTHNVFFRRQDY